MKTPPEMLSPKDCLTISDLLESILTISKKSCTYAQSIEDEKVSKTAENLSSLLKEQYSELLELLS